MIRRSFGPTLGGSALLLLILFAPTGAQPPAPLPPAPQGFDARRENVALGKVETVEYDCTASATTRPAGSGRGRPTSFSTISTPTRSSSP
jgi:hypothetical protein